MSRGLPAGAEQRPEDGARDSERRVKATAPCRQPRGSGALPPLLGKWRGQHRPSQTQPQRPPRPPQAGPPALPVPDLERDPPPGGRGPSGVCPRPDGPAVHLPICHDVLDAWVPAPPPRSTQCAGTQASPSVTCRVVKEADEAEVAEEAPWGFPAAPPPCRWPGLAPIFTCMPGRLAEVVYWIRRASGNGGEGASRCHGYCNKKRALGHTGRRWLRLTRPAQRPGPQSSAALRPCRGHMSPSHLQ